MESTLLEAMLEAAQRCGAAFSSSAETGSTVSQLIDAALRDNAVDQDSYAGGFLYRPNVVLAADRLRGLPAQGAFSPQAGALVPTRPWAGAPAAAEVYQLYALLPPRAQPGQVENWSRLVNRALQNLWTVETMPIGVGGTGARLFPLRPPTITLIAAVVVSGGSGTSIAPTGGWSTLLEVDLGTTIKLGVYARRQLLTDPTEWEFLFGAAANATGTVVAYIDTNPTSPLDASGSATASAGAAITAPSVTTTGAGERVLRIVAADDVAAYSGPTTPRLQRRVDALLQDGAAPLGLAVFDQVVTAAGASGTAGFTASTTRSQIGITLALKLRDVQHPTVFASSSLAYTPAGGATSITLTRPLNLPHDEWIPNRQAVRRVLVRTYASDDNELPGGQPSEIDMSKNGRWWRLNDGDQTLRLSFAPTTGQEVAIEVQRPYAPLVADNDTTTCDLERLALRTRVEFYSYLNSAPVSRGKYASELTQALDDWRLRENDVKPQQAVVRA